MKSLLFIDHAFHVKTKSFGFLLEVLRKKFTVREVFVDPAAPIELDMFDMDTDIVVLAQVDFLTPFFLSQGKPVVVVQMYDGSGGLPDEHWHLNRQARYLNFSQTLHVRAISNGCESLLVKYAPDPAAVPKVEDYDTLRGFFWNRLPGSNIDTTRVGKLLKGQLDNCHVHLPRDDKHPLVSVTGDFDCPVTTSDWFERKSDFDSVLASCNVFVAPRIAEGIGHAFLDAMARGMVVLAWDLPTHNEYISNWHNGVLFHQDSQVINLKGRYDLARIGRLARETIETDRSQWLADESKIIEFIDACPAPATPDLQRTRNDIQDIVGSYRAGVQSYTSELKSRSLTVNMMSQWNCYLKTEVSEAALPTLSSFNLLFGVGNARIFQHSGFSDPEDIHTWTNKLNATLIVPNRLLPNHRGRMRMQLRLQTVGKNCVKISVNGVCSATLQTGPQWATHDFLIQTGTNKDGGDTIIALSCDGIAQPKGDDPRKLGIALEMIKIYSDERYSLPARPLKRFERWKKGARRVFSRVSLRNSA